MHFLKRVIFWGSLGAGLYFLLSYHIIFVGHNVKLLRKSELTLNHTFFSTQGKKPKKILAIDDLREDGIGDILVEEGLISEFQMERYVNYYESEYED